MHVRTPCGQIEEEIVDNKYINRLGLPSKHTYTQDNIKPLTEIKTIIMYLENKSWLGWVGGRAVGHYLE